MKSKIQTIAITLTLLVTILAGGGLASAQQQPLNPGSPNGSKPVVQGKNWAAGGGASGHTGKHGGVKGTAGGWVGYKFGGGSSSKKPNSNYRVNKSTSTAGGEKP